MTKIYYDTEFVDTGREILPISIGMVKETGEELYLVHDHEGIIATAVKDEWLRENVIPSLPVRTFRRTGIIRPSMGQEGIDQASKYHWGFNWDTEHPDYPNVVPREEMMKRVRRFVLSTPKPELWAWYGSYDHVFIAQLFGRMHDLPDAFPMVTFDLKQEHVRLDSPRLPRQAEGQHNALADARHNRDIAAFLRSWEFHPSRFGKLSPILPVPVDAPNPDAPRPEPRAWDQAIGGWC